MDITNQQRVNKAAVAKLCSYQTTSCVLLIDDAGRVYLANVFPLHVSNLISAWSLLILFNFITTITVYVLCSVQALSQNSDSEEFQRDSHIDPNIDKILTHTVWRIWGAGATLPAACQCES